MFHVIILKVEKNCLLRPPTSTVIASCFFFKVSKLWVISTNTLIESITVHDDPLATKYVRDSIDLEK